MRIADAMQAQTFEHGSRLAYLAVGCSLSAMTLEIRACQATKTIKTTDLYTYTCS